MAEGFLSFLFPAGFGKQLNFAITATIFSVVIYFLNAMLGKIKNVDYLKFTEYNFSVFFFWCFGTFLISFILTSIQIVNMTPLAALTVALSWDKLFSDFFKNKNPRNPNRTRENKKSQGKGASSSQAGQPTNS